MKRVSQRKKLVLDRNVVKILGQGVLRGARGAVAESVEGDGSIYPACITTHSQVPGDC
jgi:hypothetical protein